MSLEKQPKKSKKIPVWIAIILLILVSLKWVPLFNSELPNEPEEEPEIVAIAFYTPAVADANALVKLMYGVDDMMIRNAGAIGERGAPFRKQLRVFSDEVASLEAALANHFVNRQTEDDDALENSLKADYDQWQTAATRYQSMLDAILALDTLEEKAVKETDPHPLADFRYFTVSGDYLRAISALQFTLSSEKMRRLATYYLGIKH